MTSTKSGKNLVIAALATALFFSLAYIALDKFNRYHQELYEFHLIHGYSPMASDADQADGSACPALRNPEGSHSIDHEGVSPWPTHPAKATLST